jgi:phage replication initiation protein
VASDSNKSRWLIAGWWARFLENAAKVRLALPRSERTLEKVFAWIDRQVAPSMALLTKAQGGEVGWFYDAMHDGERRLRPWQLALLVPLPASGPA